MRFAALLSVASLVLVGSVNPPGRRVPRFFCSADSVTLRSEWDRSAFVLVGVARTARSHKATSNDLGGTDYVVRPTEVLRGRIDDELWIYSEDDSGRFPLKLGRRYLLFVYRQGKTLRVDNCGHSALLADSEAELRRVRRFGLKRRNRRGLPNVELLLPSAPSIRLSA